MQSISPLQKNRLQELLQKQLNPVLSSPCAAGRALAPGGTDGPPPPCPHRSEAAEDTRVPEPDSLC